MPGVWMRLSNGREELIVHPDHVDRLLAEGGVVIPDPTLPSGEAIPESIERVVSEPEQVVVEDVPVVRKRGKRIKE